MKIKDRIYNEIEITDQVIIDIINSKVFQRLKNINQYGAPKYIQPVRDVTRYEHSIGVWHLSQKFGRSIEEQIASLVHDISHTAFSHVADFVFKDAKHEFADTKLKNIIYNSELPEIIKKYGLDLEKILDKTQFPLLDNSLPDISFDRWDYFMRDGYAMGFLNEGLINDFMNGIFEKDNILFFKDFRLASTYAILFMNFSRLIWLDPTSHGSFFLLANAIKLAFEDNLITENDLFEYNDETLMQKLKTSSNQGIHDSLDRLIPGKEFIYVDKENAEFFGPNKPRFVDPLVLHNEKLTRISDIVPSLKYSFQEFAEKYRNIGVKQL